MSFKKKGKKSWGKRQTESSGQPAFEIRETSRGEPYARIAQGGINLMIFPSNYEGTFANLMLSGRGRGTAIPVSPENISIEGNTLILDFGWLKMEMTGENIDDVIEWLDYVDSMERQPRPSRQQRQTSTSKKSWRK